MILHVQARLDLYSSLWKPHGESHGVGSHSLFQRTWSLSSYLAKARQFFYLEIAWCIGRYDSVKGKECVWRKVEGGGKTCEKEKDTWSQKDGATKMTDSLQKPVNCRAFQMVQCEQAPLKPKLSLWLQSCLLILILLFNIVNQTFYDLKSLQK